jgi:glycosyltransferase involved in cell wall biosynthesis
MKTLIIQPAYPAYRSALFNMIAHNFSGTTFMHMKSRKFSAVASRENNFLIKELDIDKQNKIHVMKCLINEIRSHQSIICFGNLNVFSVWMVIIISFFLRKKLHLWCQLRRKVILNPKGIIKILVFKLVDTLLLYTEDECENLPSYLRRKSIPLNNGINTLEIGKLRSEYKNRKKSFFTIGRNTIKSEMDFLISVFSELGASLHVIGAEKNDFRDNVGNNIKFYGQLTDETPIAAVANKCCAFVYAGDVGLSLIHAMAYGLPPIIHSNLDDHMPEVAAYKKLSKKVSFRKGNRLELRKIINSFDPAEYDGHSLDCIRVIETNFNIDKIFEKFRKILE